jgi:uncharacterized membrane protein YvbJ
MKADSYVRCPHCGEEIPSNAPACPHCGSDERTGWSSQTYLDGIDIDFEEDYEEIRENEFTDKKHKKPFIQVLIGVILLIIMLLFIVRSFI